MARAQVTVTTLTEDHLDEVARLWVERRGETGLSREHAARLVRDGRLREATERPGVRVFVALGEGRVVGYAWVTVEPLSATLDAPTVTIEEVYVDPDHRRRGVAWTLVTAAASYGQRVGAGHVTCSAPSQARDLNRVLARLGFAPAITRRVTPTAALLRRLRAKGAPPAESSVLASRRRSLRARTSAWAR